MTIPSRPAPPPPTTSASRNSLSSTTQQYNRGVGHMNNNSIVKLPPPPGVKNFPLSNNYSTFTTISSSSGNSNSTKSITRNFPPAKTRYAPATNWNGSPFDSILGSKQEQNNDGAVGYSDGNKRVPPPRPPPPKIQVTGTVNGILKTPGQPQSVNVLSNLFGRRKPQNSNKKFTSTQLNSNKFLTSNENNAYQNKSSLFQQTNCSFSLFETNFLPTSSQTSTSNDVQLITFESPPSSPTFTQKSNSDCVSVDSFSSDSNFSSPHNGSVSQPESGFEDDFSTTISPQDPWETVTEPYTDNNSSSSSSGYGIRSSNALKVAHPVRNLNAINKIQTDNHLCNGKSLLPPNPTLTMPTIIRPKAQKNFAPKPPIILPKPNLNHHTLSQNYQSQKNSNYLYEEDPPMPNCPPPPPPHESNSATYNEYDQYVDNIEDDGPAYGISLYAFDGTESGDLSFRENEKIYLINKLNDEWFMGRTKSGCEGIFPSNYIEIKIPLKDSDIKNTSQHSNIKKNETSYKIKVLYNFEGEQPEDLTIYENDLVNILYRINEDWLFGEINNRQGQFPQNFIEYVPHELPLKMP